ncbi:hypothetical protein [Bifidobacterium vansinderenii]|uniref:hypothetical protein n=1 Tax=Bifidobacterium vansinderenii TaxID=1984871 RepID=UPI0013032CF6|nr:hypothetical protein [Bifidobacterium vansinderenii]
MAISPKNRTMTSVTPKPTHQRTTARIKTKHENQSKKTKKNDTRARVVRDFPTTIAQRP